MTNIFELFAMLSKHGAVLTKDGEMHWTAAGFAAFARDWETLVDRDRKVKAMATAKPIGRPPGAKDKKPRKRPGRPRKRVAG